MSSADYAQQENKKRIAFLDSLEDENPMFTRNVAGNEDTTGLHSIKSDFEPFNLQSLPRTNSETTLNTIYDKTISKSTAPLKPIDPEHILRKRNSKLKKNRKVMLLKILI